MNYLEKHSLLERLHEFIRKGGTGSAQSCAQRLGISRAGFYRYLNILKAAGAEITYCHHRKTYRYTTDFEFNL